MEITIILVQAVLLMFFALAFFAVSRSFQKRSAQQMQMNRSLRAEYLAVADQLTLLTSSKAGDHPGLTCSEAGDLLKFYLGDAAQPKGLEEDDDD